MNEEKEERFSNVTHYTEVNVQPGGINIQHVGNLYQADFLKVLGVELEVKKKEEVPSADNVSEGNDIVGSSTIDIDTDLFHFIHPEIADDTERKRIHDSIKNLVKGFSLQDICKYLIELKDKNKILLPLSAESAYAELCRMGLPENKDGYSSKTFYKYYRK